MHVIHDVCMSSTESMMHVIHDVRVMKYVMRVMLMCVAVSHMCHMYRSGMCELQYANTGRVAVCVAVCVAV